MIVVQETPLASIKLKMVALFEQAVSFPFPFPAIAYAALNKYPNRFAAHVVSVDVLDRALLEDGTIRSERVIGVQQDSPKWLKRFLKDVDITYVREVSFVVPSGIVQPEGNADNDHKEPPKLLMASTNLSMSTIFQCRESIAYVPRPWAAGLYPSQRSFAPCTVVKGASAPIEYPRTIEDAPPSKKGGPAPNAFETPDYPGASASTLFSQSAVLFSTGMLALARWPPVGTNRSAVEALANPAARTSPQRAIGGRIEDWSLERFAANAEGGRAAMNEAARRTWELGQGPNPKL